MPFGVAFEVSQEVKRKSSFNLSEL